MRLTSKQKKRNEQFLDAYRKLESIVSEVEHCTVFELEGEFLPESEEANRLKLCRMARNFLAHNGNDDGFLSVSPAMMQFVQEEAEKENRKYKTAGEVAKKIRPVKENVSLQECVTRLNKVPFLPVVDKDLKPVGCITEESVCNAYAKMTLGVSTKVSVAVASCNICASDMPAKDISSDTIVADRSTGRYVGIIRKQ